MRIVILFIFTLFYGSCSLLKSTPDKLISYNFKGSVSIVIPSTITLDTTIMVRSEIILMKNDSTIISRFTTDENGEFSVDIKISKDWNPFFVKIVGLENKLFGKSKLMRIDEDLSFICIDAGFNEEKIYLTSNNTWGFKINCIKVWASVKKQK